MTPRPRCVVVGGAGAVGTLFAELLAGSGWAVSAVDKQSRPIPCADSVSGDILDPQPLLRALLATADVVVLAVPEPVACSALLPLARSMRPGALIVDTLSVKGPFAAEVARTQIEQQVLGVNPMFAPSLGFFGRPVAVVELRGGDRATAFTELLTSWGGRVIRVSADRHDRLAAASQALTHAAVLAFGSALAALDVGIEELTAIAPPPHRTLLALLARITTGTPEVYWDVQSANSLAPQARRALAAAARDLADLVDAGSPEDFTALLEGLRGYLGSTVSLHSAACARSFDAIR
ncbi:prephenate dehydrogenase/arogenate dehydrogenase family protein [Kutzneria chonburiensis]|uniref:Prephenate dehydrogenase/arogenate dehydrogenase family protein n=1 Tax=Kutzneria chonburiensis TaxID=1483604 RepID=A0ABV6N6F1_9PSEU|nr:prephenate dehydrogenase/arogenate dehydrogenase family protein [Kutzneria chonburiensis]